MSFERGFVTRNLKGNFLVHSPLPPVYSFDSISLQAKNAIISESALESKQQQQRILTSCIVNSAAQHGAVSISSKEADDVS